MEVLNRLRQTALITLVIVFLLLLLSLTDSSFNLGGYKFKRVDLLSDIKTTGLYRSSPLSSRLLTD
ncbi:MAG: hypothetical protein JNL63_11975, partial [Bacteroidia bacterium]|nr:hypothetical protein [Bacteroidia bacterium]